SAGREPWECDVRWECELGRKGCSSLPPPCHLPATSIGPVGPLGLARDRGSGERDDSRREFAEAAGTDESPEVQCIIVSRDALRDAAGAVCHELTGEGGEGERAWLEPGGLAQHPLRPAERTRVAPPK